ncbi:hypothetical protein SEA_DANIELLEIGNACE_73 [Arthrobacter phage DanielleIgnace]|nr:hypothetical protein SEA_DANIELLEIGNACE_73 [Arthrobacter phage DanielleIgnace]
MKPYTGVPFDEVDVEFGQYSKESPERAGLCRLTLSDGQGPDGLDVLAEKWEDMEVWLNHLLTEIQKIKANRPRTVTATLQIDVPEKLTQRAVDDILHEAAAKISAIDYVMESRVMEA